MFNIFGRKYESLHEAQLAALMPSTNFVKYDDSGDGMFAGGPCRGLWVGTAGAASLYRVDGTTAVNFPLVQGYNPFAVAGIAPGGSAHDIWLIY